MGFLSSLCGSLLKWTFFFMNLIFFLCGGALLGVGIWLAVDTTGITAWDVELPSAQNAGTIWAAAVYTSIAIGGMMFLICFFGCCGAMTESSCLLYTYVAIIGITMLGQLSFAICAVIFQDEIGEAMQEDMTEAVQTRFTDEDAVDPAAPGVSFYWNSMQADWECCGSLGPQDYVNSQFYNDTGLPVPWSCCTMTKGTWGLDPDHVENLAQCRAEATSGVAPFTYLNEQGCFTVIDEWTNRYAPVLFGIGFGFVIFHIIGIIFGCCLITSMKSNKVTDQYV